MTHERIDQVRNHFLSNEPTKEQHFEKFQQFRETAFRVALLFEQYCPESREKSLAFTNLEQAMIWAKLAIERSE